MAVMRTTLDPGFRREDSFEAIRNCIFKMVRPSRFKMVMQDRLKIIKPSIFEATSSNKVSPANAGA